MIAAALAMAATADIELLLTQRLQLVLGLTPLHAGLIVTAFAAGSLPVGVLAGGLLQRTGARPLIGGGLLLGALGVLLTLLLTPGAVPLLGGGRSPAWVVPGLVLAGAGLGIVMVAASAAIISGAPPQRAGMASSIESVSYELGSLAGVTVLGTILTAVYTNTIHLPATAPAQAAGSIDQARAAAGHLPAGQAHTLLDAAASAFDNGYTLALAITTLALAAGSAFTYRYLKRQLHRTGPAPRTGPSTAGSRLSRPAPEDKPPRLPKGDLQPSPATGPGFSFRPVAGSSHTLPPVIAPPRPPGRSISASAVPVGAVNGVPYLSNAPMSRCRSLPGSAVIVRLSGTGRSTSDSAQWAKTLKVTHRFPSPSWTAATRPGWSGTSGRAESTE